jgi:hypothetical protein
MVSEKLETRISDGSTRQYRLQVEIEATEKRSEDFEKIREAVKEILE